MPHTCDKNITRGGILRYWPIFRSPARLIEVETTSWLHIENCALCESALLQDENLSRGTHVEVRDGLSGVDRTRDHFHQLNGGHAIAHTGVQEGGEGRNHGAEDKGCDVRPPREGGLALEYDNQTYIRVTSALNSILGLIGTDLRERRVAEDQRTNTMVLLYTFA